MLPSSAIDTSRLGGPGCIGRFYPHALEGGRPPQLPASAEAQRMRFLSAVAERRNAILAAGSQTIVASYEEEGDARVLVTLPQGTVVFTREGRWLVGGPVQLRRVDP